MTPGQIDHVNGAERITAERKRQIAVEGYDAAHDDQHSPPAGYIPELLRAAGSYLHWAEQQAKHDGRLLGPESFPAWWPWSFAAWKPSSDPIRNLEKAGALIAAEIDRLLRVRGGA